LELEREIVAISERERTRIGYDLHDHVGQVLVSAKWTAQSLARKLQGHDPDRARESEQLVELIEQSINETRRVSSRLAPQVPDSLEIYPALRSLSMEVTRHSDLECTLSCSQGEKLCNAETTIHLYRIAEEGISNALKHSHARNIELNFRRLGDTYTLEVLDDGVGIGSEATRNDGVGIRSIKYRARLIEGTVDIAPRTGGGTQLVCSFPA
jgi:signal transduction histidine kinase